jgi:hypothetical protein
MILFKPTVGLYLFCVLADKDIESYYGLDILIVFTELKNVL